MTGSVRCLSAPRLTLLLALATAACGGDDTGSMAPDQGVAAGGDGAGGGAGGTPAGGTGGTGGAPELCDTATGRVNLEGPFACAAAPKFVTITSAGKSWDVFKYEASHPLADANQAFPCATSAGDFEAPDVTTPACSAEGVRPWHSVRWGHADAACAATGDGWRLCTKAELLRSCEGPEGYAFSATAGFSSGNCNVQNIYTNQETGFASEAPSGAFERCHTTEGVYDANGNLWEWIADIDLQDDVVRYFQGSGWQIIAQRHEDNEQTCDQDSQLPRTSAPSYATGFVGFRCCRDH